VKGSTLGQPNEADLTNMIATAAVYFCFIDDKIDKQDTPNRLVLARMQPTVADVCSTLRALFFVDQEVVLSCSFGINGTLQEFPENSPTPVPCNDKNSVLLIKMQIPRRRLEVKRASFADCGLVTSELWNRKPRYHFCVPETKGYR